MRSVRSSRLVLGERGVDDDEQVCDQAHDVAFGGPSDPAGIAAVAPAAGEDDHGVTAVQVELRRMFRVDAQEHLEVPADRFRGRRDALRVDEAPETGVDAESEEFLVAEKSNV